MGRGSEVGNQRSEVAARIVAASLAESSRALLAATVATICRWEVAGRRPILPVAVSRKIGQSPQSFDKEVVMGKFVTGCCCLIVGLEVLIGVPLAVVVAYAYGQASMPNPVFVAANADRAPVADEASYTTTSSYGIPSTSLGTCNSAAECQPQVNPVPLAYAPSALPPAAGYDPYVQAPPQLSVTPSPATIPRITLPESPLPISLSASTGPYMLAAPVAPPNALASAPAAVAKFGASGQISDEAEPQPEPLAAENRAPSECVAAANAKPPGAHLEQLVGDWQRFWTAAVALQPFTAGACGGEGCQLAGACAVGAEGEKAAQDALIESLHETVLHLYGEADRCEVRLDFQQADQLRKMARELRTEAMHMRQRRQATEVDPPTAESELPTAPPAPEQQF